MGNKKIFIFEILRIVLLFLIINVEIGLYFPRRDVFFSPYYSLPVPFIFVDVDQKNIK